MAELPLTVSQAAAATGLTARAVRLYESKGIVTPTARGPNGYRLYEREAVERLRFVRHARTLGLSLASAAEILALATSGRPPCQRTRALLDQRVAEIDKALAELTKLRVTITEMRDHQGAGDARWCPIIEAPLRAT